MPAPSWEGLVGSASGSGSQVDVAVGPVLPHEAIVLWVTFWPRVLNTDRIVSGIHYYDYVDLTVSKTNNAAFSHQPSAFGLSFAEWYNSQQTSGIRNINSASSSWWDPVAPVTSAALVADLPGGVRSSVHALSNSVPFNTVRVKFFKSGRGAGNLGAYSVTYRIKAYKVANLVPKITSDVINNIQVLNRTEPMAVQATPIGHSFPGTVYSFAGTQGGVLQTGTHIHASDGGDVQNTTSFASVTFPDDQVINFGLAAYWGQLTTGGYTWGLWPGGALVDTLDLPALDGYADAHYELWQRIIDPPASDNVDVVGTFGTSTDTQTKPPGTGGDPTLYYRSGFTQPFWANPGPFDARAMRSAMVSVLASGPVPLETVPPIKVRWRLES